MGCVELETRGCSRTQKLSEAQLRKLSYRVRKILIRMCAHIAPVRGANPDFKASPV